MATILVRKNKEKRWGWWWFAKFNYLQDQIVFHYYKMVVSIVGIWTKWDFMCSWPCWLIEYNHQHQSCQNNFIKIFGKFFLHLFLSKKLENVVEKVIVKIGSSEWIVYYLDWKKYFINEKKWEKLTTFDKLLLNSIKLI